MKWRIVGILCIICFLPLMIGCSKATPRVVKEVVKETIIVTATPLPATPAPTSMPTSTATATSVVSPTSTQSASSSVSSAVTSRPQLSVETLRYLKSIPVSAAIGELDMTFDTSGWEGGYRVFPGTKLAEGSMQLLWTDFKESEVQGCVAFHTEGRWGLHLCQGGAQMPADLSNFAGGRAVPVFGDTSSLVSVTTARSATPTPRATVSTTMTLTTTACLSEEDLNNITGNTDPVTKFDAYFESVTYGVNLEKGSTAKAGGIFEGTFPQGAIPAGVVNLAGGFIWRVNADTTAPNGGRWLPFCVK